MMRKHSESVNCQQAQRRQANEHIHLNDAIQNFGKWVSEAERLATRHLHSTYTPSIHLINMIPSRQGYQASFLT
jgi:hypothetical protein